MLVLENIEKSFAELNVLKFGRWEAADSESVAIVGGNGAGKTTLLEIIAGLQKPDSGSVTFDGKKISGPQTSIGIVLQEPVMFSRSVAWNVGFGLRAPDWRGESRIDRIDESLDMVGMSGFQSRDATRLSIGEKRRVAIARAIAPKPRLLLLDEPSGGVDRDNVTRIVDILRDLNDKGTTVVIATHDMEFAGRVSVRIDQLRNGKLHPYLGQNHFTCRIVAEDGGLTAHIKEGIAITVNGGFAGMADIALPPDRIVLSRDPLDSSLQNCFKGRLTGLTERNGYIEAEVDIGVPLTAMITQDSLKKLGLSIGEDVFASFRAHGVRVFPREGEEC